MVSRKNYRSAKKYPAFRDGVEGFFFKIGRIPVRGPAAGRAGGGARGLDAGEDGAGTLPSVVPVGDNAHLFDGYEPLADHPVEPGQEGLDTLGLIDYLYDDGHVL